MTDRAFTFREILTHQPRMTWRVEREAWHAANDYAMAVLLLPFLWAACLGLSLFAILRALALPYIIVWKIARNWYRLRGRTFSESRIAWALGEDDR